MPGLRGSAPNIDWFLIAPLLKQKYERCIPNMNDYLDTVKTFGIFEKLATLDKPRRRGSYLVAFEDAGIRRSTRLAALESLPVELFESILCDPALDCRDIMSVAVSSQALWVKVLQYIERDARSVGPWANTPILCPHRRNYDLPPALAEFYPDVVAAQAAFERDLKPSPTLQLGPVADWVAQVFETFTTIGEAERWRNWLDLLASPTVFEVPGEKWALRNLSTKEYVRLTISDSPVKAIVAHVETAEPWLPLDVALLFRICWHAPQRCPAELEIKPYITRHDELKQGRWAGHRFDIVRHVGLAPEDWKDETESIVTQATDEFQLIYSRGLGFKPDKVAIKGMDPAAAFSSRMNHRAMRARLEGRPRPRETDINA